MAVEAPSSGRDPAQDEPPAGDTSQGSDSPATRVAAIEEERKRLARSLNDGPSQTLSNIVLRAEMVERLLDSDPGRAREESRRLREAAVSALADVRRFMFETYPSVLEDLGLVSTLRRYLQSRSGPGRLAVELSVEGEERRLAQPAELALFRAAQEALAKADQHPGAREATLSVAFEANGVEVRVANRGGGFADREARPDESHLAGLSGLRAALAALGGEMTIETAPGQGATLTARIPNQ